LALPALQNVQSKKIVIFRGEGGRELLGDSLKARGAFVVYAECYRRSQAQTDLAVLLASKPDALTLSSSETLRYLNDLPQCQQLKTHPLFVPHPRIAAAAALSGWKNCMTTASGDDGLVESLVAWAYADSQAFPPGT
jgi:uroporphyrinogen-III synthase